MDSNSMDISMATENIKKEVWFNYFNEVLFEKKLISFEAKNQIESLINKECYQAKFGTVVESCSYNFRNPLNGHF